MMADADTRNWKVEETMMGTETSTYGVFQGTINPAHMDNFEFNDQTMENDCDFESAASSPSPLATGPVDTPEKIATKQNMSNRHSALLKSKYMYHDKRNSVSSGRQKANWRY
jgi:hypothetical protein